MNCHWSKSLCITYLTIADMRNSDINKALQAKIMNMLISKIDEEHVINDSNDKFFQILSI